jgi:hypothetical protein
MCDEYPLENVDDLDASLAAVDYPRAGVAIVRAPEAEGRNYPLFVLITEPVPPIVKTYSLAMSGRGGLPVGKFPPVAEKCSGVIVSDNSVRASVVRYSDRALAKRVIPDERHWCGSTVAGGARATLGEQTGGTLKLLMDDMNEIFETFTQRFYDDEEATS